MTTEPMPDVYIDTRNKVAAAREKRLAELVAENKALRQDIAMRPHELSALYSIREALGFNKLYPLSHLDDDVRAQRKALLACAPFAFAAIAEEKKDEIGNSDLDDEQPVALAIRTTLGAVREARRALFVANMHPGEKPMPPEDKYETLSVTEWLRGDRKPSVLAPPAQQIEFKIECPGCHAMHPYKIDETITCACGLKMLPGMADMKVWR